MSLRRRKQGGSRTLVPRRCRAEEGPRRRGAIQLRRGTRIQPAGRPDRDWRDVRHCAPQRQNGEKTKAIRHASYTTGLEFSPDGKRIASAPRGNVNKFLSVFDIAEGRSLFIAGPFENYVLGLAFTPDGKRVAATVPQKDLRLFDAASGEVVLALKRTDFTAKPGYSRDGRLLGWFEQSGYHYIDLGNKLDAK